MSLLPKYKSYFPEIRSLFDYQENVLAKLAAGKNVLSIIPTGGGKSLIFQLHGLSLKGITLVVSPLLALMTEQTEELKGRGINALAFNSNIPFDEQRKLLRNLRHEHYKFIYLSPERLQNTFFRAALLSSGIVISQIVIDEAHCISEWGGDFRPDYDQIPKFLERIKTFKLQPQVFALTATLSKEAREDIQKALGISSKSTYLHPSILRENLNLAFKKVVQEKDKLPALKEFLQAKKPKKVLAYLYSKKKCQFFASEFEKDYRTSFFHSNVEKEQKPIIYEGFKNNEYDIMFATTAFGMGMNIIDIDSVVQIQIPKSIEEYYQQVGRGWRNKRVKKTCNCLALWSDKNFEVEKKHLESNYIDDEIFDNMLKQILGKGPLIPGALKNVSLDKLMYAEENLRLFKHKLENKKVIKTLAEINGSPLTIEFKKDTPLWSKVQKAAIEFDSFSYVSKTINIAGEEIFEHLFEQELTDNIKKLPASKRDYFFKINMKNISPKIKNEIINEINGIVTYKIENLKKLKKLFESKNPEKYLASILK